MCFGGSKEPSHRDGSFEYPQYMFWLRNKKTNIYFKSKEEGKDQESIQSSTPPDSGHHIGKWQKHKKTSHILEPRGQPFPAGDFKAVRNAQDSITKTNMKQITKSVHLFKYCINK